jgi:hypothetical protein
VRDSLIAESLQVARKNWKDWHDVFEHVGSVNSNPLLANYTRFASFLREYSVNRTVKAGTHDKFRCALRSGQFLEAIRDHTGHALDELEATLRSEFGTHEPKRGIVSVLSKVAAFVKPERFVAWDAYAKKGLNIVSGRTASAKFNTYADYLAMFDRAWDGQPGQEIRDYVARAGAKHAVERRHAFCGAS